MPPDDMRALMPDRDQPPMPLARAHRHLIVRRLPIFAIGWSTTALAWALVLGLESPGALGAAGLLLASQLAVLAAGSLICRRDPVAARVSVVVVLMCVALGLLSTALFAAVHGHAEVLAFVLLTLYLASALLFAWGWRAELLLLAGTLAAWVMAFPFLRFAVPRMAFATAVVIGAVVSLAIAEASARAFWITFRQRAGEAEHKRALEASRDAYRDLAEKARDFIYTADLEGRFTYVNEALANFLDEPVTALLGRSFIRELMTDHPANPDAWSVLARVAAGEAMPPLVVQLETARGLHWLEALISGIRDADGRVVGVRGISRDVTERHAAEDALRDSEARSRALLRALPDMMFRMNRAGDFLDFHAEQDDALVMPRDAIIGTNVRATPMPPEVIATIVEATSRALAGTMQSIEYALPMPQGTREYEARIVESGEDEVVAVVRDITQRKRAERRLAVQYTLTRVLAESATLAEATSRILPGICESLGWEVGALWQVDQTAAVLRCVEVWHVPACAAGGFGAISRTITFPPGIGLPGRVWASGAPAWVPDVTLDANFPRAAVAAEEKLHGAFAFPILFGSEVAGVIEFFSHAIEPPDEDLLAMVAVIGSRIGQFAERKRAEDALRESEERYRGLVESPAALICRLDLEGRFTFVNDAYSTKLGKRREELLGESFVGLVHVDDLPATRAAIRRTLEAPPNRGDVDCRVRTPEGWCWTAWEGCAIKDEQGTTVELQAVGRDVTERKHAEQALRKSEERYRGLVESQEDMICRFDRKGHFTFVNDAYCRKVGKRHDQLLGTSFVSLIHADDLAARAAAMRNLEAPPYRARVEVRGPTPEGWRWISWEACAIKDERGQTVEYQAVGRDVTERRAAEEALRASLRELRESEEKLRLLAQRQVIVREEERKRLGFDLHDDVCQELVGVAILVESLRRRLAPLPAAAAAELDRIVRYLNEVVEHLRLLARDLRPLLLHDLGLEGCLCSLADGMSSAATSVVAEFPTVIPRLDETTELAIYRIAQEALANAARHAAARAIVLTLGVHDGTLRLEVRDDGCGFSPDARRRSQALGLVSMEERALALGGRFEVWSEPGKGTAVQLECPLASRAPATAA